VEMIRQIKVAKDVAVKGGDDAHRTVRRATSGSVTTLLAATKRTPRAIARRWLQLRRCSSSPGVAGNAPL